MLVAHWLYLFAASIELYAMIFSGNSAQEGAEQASLVLKLKQGDSPLFRPGVVVYVDSPEPFSDDDASFDA
jgi:hypothetical protein